MTSHVGRVDDEAGIAGLRVVGQHVEPCPMEEGGVVRFRNAVAPIICQVSPWEQLRGRPAKRSSRPKRAGSSRIASPTLNDGSGFHFVPLLACDSASTVKA